jgi:hypothetical protein
MRGTLYVQRTKTGAQIKKPAAIVCDLAFDNDTAYVFIGSDQYPISKKLVRARVSLITPDGLKISGLEESGPIDNPTLRFQEWWFIPTTH